MDECIRCEAYVRERITELRMRKNVSEHSEPGLGSPDMQTLPLAGRVCFFTCYLAKRFLASSADTKL